METTLSPTERAVLGVTVGSPKNLEAIYHRLHHRSSTTVPLEQAADAICSLMERGLLTSRPQNGDALPDSSRQVWKAYFEPTDQGRKLIEEQRPPGAPPGWPEGRIYFGMFRGLLPDITEAEIDEARAEMWGNFPRDLPE